MEQIELIEPTILFFLCLDICPERRLINSNSRNEIPTSPEMLTYKILSPPQKHPRNLNGALPLDKPYHLRNSILGRNRNQHVNMIGEQMPFQNLTLLPLREVLEQ